MRSIVTRSKKADMSIQTIIVVILLMVVLAVLLYVFKDQLFKSLEGFDFLRDNAQNQAEGKNCLGIIQSDHKCQAKKPGEGYYELTSPDGGWEDCKTICWEKS